MGASTAPRLASSSSGSVQKHPDHLGVEHREMIGPVGGFGVIHLPQEADDLVVELQQLVGQRVVGLATGVEVLADEHQPIDQIRPALRDQEPHDGTITPADQMGGVFTTVSR